MNEGKLVSKNNTFIANNYKKPIALIPSRRQVEAKELGGGYVNNWSTEDFVDFVRIRDKGGYVKLSRDHSGPWQLKANKDNGEVLSYLEAMEEVKFSLKTDLSLGFDLIHLDPSQGLQYGRSKLEVEDDILELLEYCQRNQSRECAFEIGADEQSTIPELVSDAEMKIRRILKNIKQQPLLIVFPPPRIFKVVICNQNHILMYYLVVFK